MRKYIEELVAGNPPMHINATVADSFGLCLFSMTVAYKNLELISNSISDVFDARVTPDFIRNIGLETLRLEATLNKTVALDEEDNKLPSFFHDELLPPTDKIARLRDSEVNVAMQNLLDVHDG